MDNEPHPGVIETGLSPHSQRLVIEAVEYSLVRLPHNAEDRKALMEAHSLLMATEQLHGWHLRRRQSEAASADCDRDEYAALMDELHWLTTP